MTRVEARDATTHELRFVHTESLIEEVAATAGVDRHRFDADTYALRPLLRGRAARRRRHPRRNRGGAARRNRFRLLLRPPARPPRHARPRDGLLPLQQRRRCRCPSARGAGDRPRRDHRHRRPPRQRHAGHLLRRPARPLLLDPPVPALPRHRPLDRDGLRRGRRHDNQRPAPPGLRRRHLPPLLHRDLRPRRPPLPPAAHLRLRRLRRPLRRPARRHPPQHPRLLRHRDANPRTRRRAMRRAASSTPSRAATTSPPSPGPRVPAWTRCSATASPKTRSAPPPPSPARTWSRCWRRSSVLHSL